MPDPVLSEEHRQKLDGIVSQMEANQEPPENIQFVVDDFKKKYATPDVEVAGVDLTPTGQRISGFQERLGSAVAAPYSVGKAAYDTSEQHRTDAEAAAKRGDFARAALHLIGATPQSAIAENLIVKPSKDQFDKAKAAYDKGDYKSTLLHGLAMFPVAGPLLASITEDATSGDPKRQGAAVADVASLVAPEAMRVLPSKVRVPGLGGGNALEQSAVRYAESKGIPTDAGTATQNIFVKGAQNFADRTIGGSMVAKTAKEAQEAAISGDVGRLAGQVHPTAVSPEGAGNAVRSGLRAEMGTQKAIADPAYDKLRTIEASTPAMAVDYTNLKRVLQPIRDQMYRQLPVTVQDASTGFHALEQILKGPDRVPLSIADADRSVISQIAHEADPHVRSFGQGIAAKTAGMMDTEIQKAAALGGPDAVAALKEGRAATAAKYAAVRSLKEFFGPEFKGEPVGAFDKATISHDAGIERLERLQKTNPDALPQIGRAYLDDMAALAQREGGFAHTDKLWSHWNNLGPRTKELLFKDPQVIKDLDNLFLFAKRASENINPSSSAHTALIYGQTGELMLAPAAFAFGPHVGGTVAAASLVPQITGPVLAKLLRSPAGIRALRDGFMLPINSQGARKAIQVIQAARIESQSTNGQ